MNLKDTFNEAVREKLNKEKTIENSLKKIEEQLAIGGKDLKEMEKEIRKYIPDFYLNNAGRDDRELGTIRFQCCVGKKSYYNFNLVSVIRTKEGSTNGYKKTPDQAYYIESWYDTSNKIFYPNTLEDLAKRIIKAFVPYLDHLQLK